MRKIRYQNRKEVDELILPILNLDLVSKKSEDQKEKLIFPTLPLKFTDAIQYHQHWLQLFLYEMYNQMIN